MFFYIIYFTFMVFVRFDDVAKVDCFFLLSMEHILVFILSVT